MNENSSISGLIFSLKRYSIHDGPGIRTTVFLKGCPLSCWWCHNPEGIPTGKALFLWEERCLGCGDCQKACPSKAVYREGNLFKTEPSRCTLAADCVAVCPAEAREIIGEEIGVEPLLERIGRDTVFFDQSGGGVTFSGGEPLAQPVFLEAVLKGCHEAGLHTAVDTSGYAESGVFRTIIPYTDLFLFDLKFMDSDRHKTYTGVSNEPIRDNLLFLAESGADVIIRIPVVPGMNDDRNNMTAIADFLQSLKTLQRIDLLPYHKMSLEKYRRMQIVSRFEPETDSVIAIKDLESLFAGRGFQVSVGG